MIDYGHAAATDRGFVSLLLQRFQHLACILFTHFSQQAAAGSLGSSAAASGKVSTWSSAITKTSEWFLDVAMKMQIS